LTSGVGVTILQAPPPRAVSWSRRISSTGSPSTCSSGSAARGSPCPRRGRESGGGRLSRGPRAPHRSARPRGRKDGSIAEGRRGLKHRAEKELREAERLGIRLIALTDPDYPAAFEALPDAPILLYVKGALREGVVRIAVVGSRRATAYGRRIATGLSGGLVHHGIEIVSGGARVSTLAPLGGARGGRNDDRRHGFGIPQPLSLGESGDLRQNCP